MACPAVLTGQSFLGSALAHIDCQAQTIGAYGFGALAAPGSMVTVALTSLLTVFVALYGIRLMLGYPMAGRDVVVDVLKVGIVLTLATSWPAWRILGYDLVISGPEQLAHVVGLAAQLPGGGGDLTSHLQRVDEGLAALNTYGSGRLGIAQGDWFQLGMARSVWLVGTLGPLALVRLSAGILLALAPLMTGLLLFGITRGLFAGWARGLVMVYLASLSLNLILGAELALIEPWLGDVLTQRAADQQTLEAPIEILVVTLAFTLTCYGAITVAGWIAFHPSTGIATVVSGNSREPMRTHAQERILVSASDSDTSVRARAVAMAVSESVLREDRLLERMQGMSSTLQGDAARAGGRGGSAGATAAGDSLGSSWRRNSRRVSRARTQRDGGS